MSQVADQKEVVVASGRHISKLYTQIHREYRSTGSKSKPGVEQREWMTLISFLDKNKTRRCKTIRLKYPFTILKQERPDFILTSGRGSMNIEIARVTSKNLEAMKSLCNNNGFPGYEFDPRLLSNEYKMTRDELLSLVWRPGKCLGGNGEIGFYRERMWTELMHHRIVSKSMKDYTMDVLLLDDHHIQSCYKRNVLKRLEFLKILLNDKPIRITNIKTVISEAPAGVIILYDKGEWKLNYKQYMDYDF